MKKQKGITLIALIITIIVMLVLVGVSVSVALNGGLFSTAKNAATNTEKERDKELALDDGIIEVDGKKYANYQDYLDGNEILVLPEGWTVAETKPEGWSANVTAITDGTNTVPLPKGFKVSTVETEDEVDEGLVIKDGGNEFVWIPTTTDFTPTYTVFGMTEPAIPTDATQEILDEYYGTNHYTIENTDAYKNNVENVFAFEAHYSQMVESVNKYNGFYIGRYETTIDNGVIGCAYGKTVLETGGGRYAFDLYALNRNSNISGNGSVIQTNVMSVQQYEAVKSFLDLCEVDHDPSNLFNDGATWSTGPQFQNGALAGLNTYTTINDPNYSDVLCNVYDLHGNFKELGGTCLLHIEDSIPERFGPGEYMQFLGGDAYWFMEIPKTTGRNYSSFDLRGLEASRMSLIIL